MISFREYACHQDLLLELKGGGILNRLLGWLKKQEPALNQLMQDVAYALSLAVPPSLSVGVGKHFAEKGEDATLPMVIAYLVSHIGLKKYFQFSQALHDEIYKSKDPEAKMLYQKVLDATKEAASQNWI